MAETGVVRFKPKILRAARSRQVVSDVSDLSASQQRVPAPHRWLEKMRKILHLSNCFGF